MNRTPPSAGLVSVVLPTYKRAHLLGSAIRSVLDQTYANLELLVVDDNSPDDTSQVVASFGDPRIRYVRNESNLKLPRTLNRGFSLSRGDYLTWTSDDNLYRENALGRMVDAMLERQCDFVYADYYLFADLDSDGKPVDVHHDRLPDIVQLEKGNHIGACFLYSRAAYDAVGEYDPELFLVEDYDYFMRIAKRFPMCHIAEPLYYFRRHDDALFVSRFCEVKAADVLVRYKNDLLDDIGALDAVVTLLMRNADDLRNPLFRTVERSLARTSYRLTAWYRKALEKYLRLRLRNRFARLLNDYRAKRIAFVTARDTLCGLMREFAAVAYSAPRRR
jgi:glycosyltransferase involved in cell wall biosynthesis